jgi:hypothetical protein
MEAVHYPLPHHRDSNLNLSSLQFRLEASPPLPGGEVQQQLPGDIDRKSPETGQRWRPRPVSPPCFSGKDFVLAKFCLFGHQIWF